MRIALGELMPDQPDVANDGLEEALNCIPYELSYGPFPSPQVFSSSLSGTAVGAISVRDTSGTVYTFAGTATQLYRASATGWANVSRTATYNTAVDGRWSFALFGNNLLAANGADAMQIFVLGTSTQFLDQSASASAPVATYLATGGDFAFAANITTLKNRVQWSRINNVRRWTPSVQFQSDFQDLPSGGDIQGITSGDVIHILTRSSAWRGDYVGSPLVWQFNEIAPAIGCKLSGSVSRFQHVTFFYSDLGFHAFDGVTASPIGSGKIDEFFEADLNIGFQHNVTSVIDSINKLYIISYPNVESAAGQANRFLIYKWTVGRWTRVEESVEVIYAGLSAGFTLDGLDAVSGSIDALPFSLDSAQWQGGSLILSAINTSHRSVTFDGPAKTAIFITGESQIVEDNRAFINAIRPLVQGTSGTAITTTVGARDRLIESVSFGMAVAMNSIGKCPQRSNGRFHRLRMDVSGSFTRAVGFDVTLVKDGMR